MNLILFKCQRFPFRASPCWLWITLSDGSWLQLGENHLTPFVSGGEDRSTWSQSLFPNRAEQLLDPCLCAGTELFGDRRPLGIIICHQCLQTSSWWLTMKWTSLMPAVLVSWLFSLDRKDVKVLSSSPKETQGAMCTGEPCRRQTQDSSHEGELL